VKRILGVLTVLVVGFLFESSQTRAEVFVLQSGGQIVGEVLNPDENPREKYVIKTEGGGQITLAKSQIKQIVFQRPEEIEYEKIRARYADTVEGQWDLAEWCREHKLSSLREKHLTRILELNPDHEQARRALGYSQIDGQWMTQKDAMVKQGYRYYKGRYRLPQEIELMEQQRKTELAEKEWMKKLNTWRAWLDTDKGKTAHENISSITDPMAIKALTQALKEEKRDSVRLLLVEALGRIGTSPALIVLAKRTMEDPVEEVSLTCLDQLKEKKDPEAVKYFIGKLGSKLNPEINRAAVALRHLGDPSAIGPLIDALVTTHKFKVVSGNPGQMSAGFGSSGPSGFSAGNSTKIISQQFSNRSVLEALVELTGGLNYGFDVQAWKAWHTSQKKRPDMNSRRG
jgi:hypothetical protein